MNSNAYKITAFISAITVGSGTGFLICKSNQALASEQEKRVELKSVEIRDKSQEDLNEMFKYKNISKNQNFLQCGLPTGFLNFDDCKGISGTSFGVEKEGFRYENDEIREEIRKYKKKIFSKLGLKEITQQEMEHYFRTGETSEENKDRLKNFFKYSEKKNQKDPKIVFYSDASKMGKIKSECEKSIEEITSGDITNAVPCEILLTGYEIQKAYLDEEENCIVVIGESYNYNAMANVRS